MGHDNKNVKWVLFWAPFPSNHMIWHGNPVLMGFGRATCCTNLLHMEPSHAPPSPADTYPP